MADTQFLRGTAKTALVPQVYDKELFKESFESNPLAQYMGLGSDNIIQTKMQLQKAKGDKISFGIRKLLSGSGQTDDGTYAGNEEAMSFMAFSLAIHERGNGVRLSGGMTEQSALTDLRAEGRAALKEWIGRVTAADIISALSGLSTKSFAGQITGANALDVDTAAIGTVQQFAPSRSTTAMRYFCGGQTASGALSARVANIASLTTTTGYVFGTRVIDQLALMAKAQITSAGVHQTPIRPVIVDGEPKFLLLVGPYQAKALRADTVWTAAAQAFWTGKGRNNPIYNGALGEWQGVIVKECQLIHRRLGAGAYAATEYFDATTEAAASGISIERALFLGAQAACVAYGSLPKYAEGYGDPGHNTKAVFHADMIYGVGATGFDASALTGTPAADSDFGRIICDTTVIL